MTDYVEVTCLLCGDKTVFLANGTSPNNDHITLVSGTPLSDAKYKCNSCGTDSSVDTGIQTEFREQEQTYNE